MTPSKLEVNKNKKVHGTAPLRNILMLDELIRRAINREDHLPGIVGFSGPSGFGKSTAAAFIAAKHQAYYIEVRSTWTKKAFLEQLVRLMGAAPKKIVHEMADQAVDELGRSQRPLIIDEFDNAVERGLIELVRDIYEQAKSPIVIIGEERLPLKVKKWERFDGRILDWAQAQPADFSDARALNMHYTPDIAVNDDLLEKVVKASNGSVRRIVTNLDRIATFSRLEGLKKIGLAEWGTQPIHTGSAPKMREW